MNNLLIIALFVSICLNIYSNPFMKLSFMKISNLYKKIKINEPNIFQIEELDNMVLKINGSNYTSTNYTFNTVYPRKHVGYEFAMLLM